MTPNGEHQENSPFHSWRRVKILTPRHLRENPNLVMTGSAPVPMGVHPPISEANQSKFKFAFETKNHAPFHSESRKDPDTPERNADDTISHVNPVLQRTL